MHFKGPPRQNLYKVQNLYVFNIFVIKPNSPLLFGSIGPLNQCLMNLCLGPVIKDKTGLIGILSLPVHSVRWHCFLHFCLSVECLWTGLIHRVLETRSSEEADVRSPGQTLRMGFPNLKSRQSEGVGCGRWAYNHTPYWCLLHIWTCPEFLIILLNMGSQKSRLYLPSQRHILRHDFSHFLV